MTVRELCKDLPINFSDEQYFELGYRIASVWDSMKIGDKKFTEEFNIKVRDYPSNFLKLLCVEKVVIKFATGKYKKKLILKNYVKTNK